MVVDVLTEQARQNARMPTNTLNKSQQLLTGAHYDSIEEQTHAEKIKVTPIITPGNTHTVHSAYTTV